MKVLSLILVVVFAQPAFGSEDFKLISSFKDKTAGVNYEDTFSCHNPIDFTGRVTTSAAFISRNVFNMHYVMMKGHQAHVYKRSKDSALCLKIQELIDKKTGVFTYSTHLYSADDKLKEVVEFEFENGLKMTSEEIYHLD